MMQAPPVPLANSAIIDTVKRLGAPPEPLCVGWVSWVEEAAGLLCARISRGDPTHHRHSPPCFYCRNTVAGLLQGT